MNRIKLPVNKSDELWKLIRNGRDITLTAEVVRKEMGGQTDRIEVA
jgi:hypothetical protein